MIRIIVFLVASIPILIVSRHALRHPKSHGFYRTFAWEGILVLFLLNVDFWFVDPFSAPQIVAWILLILSLVLITSGLLTLWQIGRPDPKRQNDSLVGIEKTTRLVVVGIYRYIRHPLYSSLLFLAWGILFKHLSWPGFTLTAAISTLLFITGKVEEGENIAFFGEQYCTYMKKTKMFIPFII